MKGEKGSQLPKIVCFFKFYASIHVIAMVQFINFYSFLFLGYFLLFMVIVFNLVEQCERLLVGQFEIYYDE